MMIILQTRRLGDAYAINCQLRSFLLPTRLLWSDSCRYPLSVQSMYPPFSLRDVAFYSTMNEPESNVNNLRSPYHASSTTSLAFERYSI